MSAPRIREFYQLDRRSPSEEPQPRRAGAEPCGGAPPPGADPGLCYPERSRFLARFVGQCSIFQRANLTNAFLLDLNARLKFHQLRQ
jgi:hypothetical protein